LAGAPTAQLSHRAQDPPARLVLSGALPGAHHQPRRQRPAPGVQRPAGLDGGGLRALPQFKPGPNEASDFWPTVALTVASPSAASAPGDHLPGVRHGRRRPLLAVPGAWTPHSRRPVINSNGFRLNAAIYRVRPDGTGLRRLTRPGYPHNDILPARQPGRCDRGGDRLTAALAGRVGDRGRPAVRPRPGTPADRALRAAGRPPQARRAGKRPG